MLLEIATGQKFISNLALIVNEQNLGIFEEFLSFQTTCWRLQLEASKKSRTRYVPGSDRATLFEVATENAANRKFRMLNGNTVLRLLETQLKLLRASS